MSGRFQRLLSLFRLGQSSRSTVLGSTSIYDGRSSRSMVLGSTSIRDGWSSWSTVLLISQQGCRRRIPSRRAHGRCSPAASGATVASPSPSVPLPLSETASSKSVRVFFRMWHGHSVQLPPWRAMSDVGACVAGFGPLVHGGNR